MSKLCCDLLIHINGQEKFFLKEKIVANYSELLKKIAKNERRRTQIKKLKIEFADFPGGSNGFELISRFCYNNGEIKITVSNVTLLYCSAVFLGMTEKISPNNLSKQTENFLEGMFYWSWKEILTCLKSCESIFTYADSSGLIEKLIYAMLSKIAQSQTTSSDLSLLATSGSSSPSSPETPLGFRISSSSKTTPESIKLIRTSNSSSNKPWWFNDLTILPPMIIEKVIQSLGAFGSDNNSLILTKFILHYLKVSSHQKGSIGISDSRLEFMGLVKTAVYGVTLVGNRAFSCRTLFSVLRILSGYGLNKENRVALEKLIGEIIEEATLDDLLVCGRDKGVYDVNLVIRLIKVFVSSEGVCLQKLKKVGKLIDKYLGEISPDHSLKVSKFLGVAESLPDSARDCFDGVYRAIDIYLEAHPKLSFEERSKLCRCLNYHKLSLEACKELAKNPKIPPRITIQALMSQQSKVVVKEVKNKMSPISIPSESHYQSCDSISESYTEEKEDVKLNLQKMQTRVVELEKVCIEMKNHMSRLVRHNIWSTPTQTRTFSRFC